jgi:predicted DNA repair protein MutK
MPALGFAPSAIFPHGIFSTVLRTLADLAAGVIVGAVVLGVVKMIGKLWRRPIAAAANKAAA